MAYATFIFRDKCVFNLKVREGDMKVKKGNPETKQVEQTNEVRHGKCQTFTISLGGHGKHSLGCIDCEYGGDKQLIDKQHIQVGQFYLKQKTGMEKDPRTFIAVKKVKHVLVLKDFDKQIEREKSQTRVSEKTLFIKQNQSPEQLIKLGEGDMNKDFGNLDIEEEKVSVNEEFDKMDDLIKNYNKE